MSSYQREGVGGGEVDRDERGQIFGSRRKSLTLGVEHIM